MFKQTLITLISLLTIAAAINANFEDNIFYVELENRLSYKMFQTRGGIIAQDVDTSGNSELYMLINLQTKNTSVILSDIVNACNAKVGNFDRLHYHAATSTLIYYCLQNNSLLLIDDSSYTVDLVIPTNVNTVFDEVKLIPQGYSIAVLGMIGLFAETPGTSELITIDLQAKAVASHVVFNLGLNSGEAVVGYTVSSNNLLYILTNTYTGTNENRTTDYRVGVYSMFLIGNSYTLNNLTSMSFHYNNYPIISELYSVGNLLVVSYNKTVDIMTQQGNVIGSLEHLAVKSPLDVGYIAHVALAVESGNSEFYALLHNKTLFKFTVQNGGYNREVFAEGIQDMQYVTSNLTSNSLLFTIDELDLFNITDLQTSQTLYTAITGGTVFMVSDTTYAVVGQPDKYVAYVFNRNTNLLIFQTEIGYNYFYDENANLISFMEHNSDRTQCQMVQFNIQTTNSSIPFTLDPSYGTDCHSYHFINVTNNLDNPQFLLNVWGKLLIFSHSFGLVNYGDFESDDFSIPFVDYDTLTVYRAVAKLRNNNEVKIEVYTYNSNNSTFTLQNTTQVEQFSVYSLYPAPGQLMIMGLFEFEFVDVSATFNKNVVKYSGAMGNISFFQDKNGVVYMILGYFDVYDGNQVTTLPGITDNTRTSHAAGQCRYTLVDQVNDLTMIRFYNVCPQGLFLSHIHA